MSTITTPAPAAPPAASPLADRDEYGPLHGRPSGLFTQPPALAPALSISAVSPVEQLL